MAGDPFRIRDHVSAFDTIVGDLAARSAATRATLPMVADLAYGEDPSETVDLFFPPGRRAGLPVHVFIHGGYWRAFSKRDYSLIAETVTAAGAVAAILDYALMPQARMAVLVDQVRRAGRWLRERIGDHGGDADRITVSGHSAGAHLATFLFEAACGPTAARGALLLGGLYDLKPLQSSFLQAEIGLTDEEADNFSPLARRHHPGTVVTILVGADETPPFHAQADAFARHLAGQGLGVSQAALPGRHHMDSVRDLALPGTPAAEALTALIRSY